MTPEQFEAIKTWFDNYVTPFCDTDPEGARNIRLKIDHTARVCDAMKFLAEGERLSPDERLTAAAIALLHDVGRFPQYRRWRTFRDSDSDNHARMSVDVIREQLVLGQLDDGERLAIEEAVRFHNQLFLPPRLRSGSDRFLRMIRDADKIDIWRVFLDYFSLPEGERASATMLGLPDLPGVSVECLRQLEAQQVVRLDTVTRINDFKLLLLSWVYDLNFPASFRLVIENCYIDRLQELLPVDGVAAGVEAVRSHAAARAGAFSP